MTTILALVAIWSLLSAVTALFLGRVIAVAEAAEAHASAVPDHIPSDVLASVEAPRRRTRSEG